MSESKQHYSDKSGGGHRCMILIRRSYRPPPHNVPHNVDRLEHRLRRQVRVAHRHLRIVVAEELLHLV